MIAAIDNIIERGIREEEGRGYPPVGGSPFDVQEYNEVSRGPYRRWEETPDRPPLTAKPSMQRSTLHQGSFTQQSTQKEKTVCPSPITINDLRTLIVHDTGSVPGMRQTAKPDEVYGKWLEEGSALPIESPIVGEFILPITSISTNVLPEGTQHDHSVLDIIKELSYEQVHHEDRNIIRWINLILSCTGSKIEITEGIMDVHDVLEMLEPAQRRPIVCLMKAILYEDSHEETSDKSEDESESTPPLPVLPELEVGVTLYEMGLLYTYYPLLLCETLHKHLYDHIETDNGWDLSIISCKDEKVLVVKTDKGLVARHIPFL
jgi:hypothetical protein